MMSIRKIVWSLQGRNTPPTIPTIRPPVVRYAKSYFWRTTGQQEIDYIEEKDGRFTLFEIKSNPKKANTKLPKVFMENYDVEKTAVITPTNWSEWLM